MWKKHLKKKKAEQNAKDENHEGKKSALKTQEICYGNNWEKELEEYGAPMSGLFYRRSSPCYNHILVLFIAKILEKLFTHCCPHFLLPPHCSAHCSRISVSNTSKKWLSVPNDPSIPSPLTASQFF